jgi:hypothetical protein
LAGTTGRATKRKREDQVDGLKISREVMIEDIASIGWADSSKLARNRARLWTVEICVSVCTIKR